MSQFRSDQFNLQPVDYSPLFRGMEQAGAGIGSAIQGYRRGKREEKLNDAFEESVSDDGSIDLKTFVKKAGDRGAKLSSDELLQFSALIQQQDAIRGSQRRGNVEAAKAQQEFVEKRNKADTEEAEAWYSMDQSKTPVDFYGMDPSSVMKGFTRGSKNALDAKNIQSQIADREAPEAPQQDARDRKISDYMNSFGVSRQEAIDVIDGNLKIVTDPVAGNSVSYNERTGESKPIDLPIDLQHKALSDTLAPGLGAGEGSINLYEAAANTTGFWPTISNLAQGVVGQVGMQIADPEVQEAIQNFETVKRELVRALVDNPKFPTTEMERIRKEVDIGPGAFKDVQTLRAQMRGVDSALRNRLANMTEMIYDRNLPADTRQAAAQGAKDISNFLRVLAVPQGEPEAEPKSGPPEGVEPAVWEVMTPEEKALWQ